jgi:hypothetical protein
LELRGEEKGKENNKESTTSNYITSLLVEDITMHTES